MNFEDTKKYSGFYDRQKKIIDRKLANSLIDKEPKSLYEPISYIIESPGKRLRPFLVLLSAKAVGGNINNVYNAALAVEMLHNFTLIHDDIMDNADLRRGNLTLHKKYNLNTAILAGDSLLAVGYEYLLKDCKVNIKQALNSFTQGLIEVCEGQRLDTEFENRTYVSLNEYVEMITKKTASLIQTCCELGAYISNGSKSDIHSLKSFGKYLGIAFQIQDDLLDITADKAEFGKKIGGDLLEGKKTFLFIEALSRAKGKDKSDLLSVIKNKGIKPNQINYYKSLYEKLNVLSEAKSAIISYSNKALRAISKLSNKHEIEIFYWLTELLIKRNK